MRIFITTLGSRGDVQPYIALGQRLMQRGHIVTLCTCEKFKPMITQQGLEYGYMNNQFMELMQTDISRKLMDNNADIFAFIKYFIKLSKQLKPMQWASIDDITQAAMDTRPDLILYHPKTFIAAHVAEKLNVPKAVAFLMPLMVASGDRPEIGFPNLPLGKWYNRMTSRLLLRIVKMTSGSYIKGWRKKHGLKPVSGRCDFLHDSDGKPIDYLLGYSEHVCPRPNDWPDHVHVTGYWPLQRTDDWQPPDALARFLDEGDPPVYIGFGSMSGRDPKRLSRVVIDAIKQAQVRAVLATGWGGLDTDDLPESIFKIDQVPHDWLFPRCSAVVHHGGAGTTAAGLRAGKPTVVCAFALDQPFWAQRVYELGAGSKPLRQKKLTANQLANAITQVTTDPTIKHKAQQIGEQLRHEDGLSHAVNIIEKLI
jgi:sterol 3beta-glucosyltransferase